MTVFLAIAAVLAIIFVVPFVIYGAGERGRLVDLPPGASPRRFLLGVGLTKLFHYPPTPPLSHISHDEMQRNRLMFFRTGSVVSALCDVLHMKAAKASKRCLSVVCSDEQRAMLV